MKKILLPLRFGSMIAFRMGFGFLIIFVSNLFLGQAGAVPNNPVTNAIIGGLGIPGVLLLAVMKYLLHMI